MANIFSWPAPYAGIVMLILSVIVLGLIGLNLWQARRLGRLERHYHLLLAGTEGGDLEAVLESHMHELRSALCQVRELETHTLQMERASRSYLQHFALRRYNPFRETGGDQSFVLALTDADGNGAVLSSLHSRDVTRIYAKPLAGWTSAYPLTEEETESLAQARQK